MERTVARLFTSQLLEYRDAARAYKHTACNPDQWSQLVYNIGSNDENYQVADIAEIVRDELDTDLDITYLEDKQPGPSYHVNFDRVNETGFEVDYSVREGVRELADAFMNTTQQPLTQ